LLHLTEKTGQTAHFHPAESFWQYPAANDAIFKRVTRSSGYLGSVRKNPPTPIGRSADISGIQIQKYTTRGLNTQTWPQKIWLSIQQARGNAALF
jgi:hypothetical protein